MTTQHAGSTAGSESAPASASGEGSVQSVARALAVLEALADADGEIALAHLAETLELPVPTVHRLLKTLAARGYVRQADSRRYVLGPALIRLGLRATPQLALEARPALQELENEFGETANLAVLDGDLIVYVAQVPSRHRMRMFTEVGRRALPHATGVGKAMLATLPDERVRALVRRTGMPAFTDATLATEEALLADLRETRRRGFAVDDGEQEVGVRCIAVAVAGVSGSAAPTAVSISGPATRVTEAVIPGAVAALTRAARTLSGRA